MDHDELEESAINVNKQSRRLKVSEKKERRYSRRKFSKERQITFGAHGAMMKWGLNLE